MPPAAGPGPPPGGGTALTLAPDDDAGHIDVNPLHPARDEGAVRQRSAPTPTLASLPLQLPTPTQTPEAAQAQSLQLAIAELRAEMEEKMQAHDEQAQQRVTRIASHGGVTFQPTNLHLAAIFYASDWSSAADPQAPKKRWGLLSGCFVLVMLQCVTVLAVLLGTSLPRCAVNSHCSSIDGGEEWFCTGAGSGQADPSALPNRCVCCPGAPLVHPIAGPPAQLDFKTGGTFNDPYVLRPTLCVTQFITHNLIAGSGTSDNLSPSLSVLVACILVGVGTIRCLWATTSQLCENTAFVPLKCWHATGAKPA